MSLSSSSFSISKSRTSSPPPVSDALESLVCVIKKLLEQQQKQEQKNKQTLPQRRVHESIRSAFPKTMDILSKIEPKNRTGILTDDNGEEVFPVEKYSFQPTTKPTINQQTRNKTAFQQRKELVGQQQCKLYFTDFPDMKLISTFSDNQVIEFVLAYIYHYGGNIGKLQGNYDTLLERFIQTTTQITNPIIINIRGRIRDKKTWFGIPEPPSQHQNKLRGSSKKASFHRAILFVHLQSTEKDVQSLLQRKKVKTIQDERVLFDFKFNELLEHKPTWYSEYKENVELKELMKKYYSEEEPSPSPSPSPSSTSILSLFTPTPKTLQEIIQTYFGNLPSMKIRPEIPSPPSDIGSKATKYLQYLWERRFLLYRYFNKGGCQKQENTFHSIIRGLLEERGKNNDYVGLCVGVVFLKNSANVDTACKDSLDDNYWKYLGFKDEKFYVLPSVGDKWVGTLQQIPSDHLNMVLYQGHFDELMDKLPLTTITSQYYTDVKKRYQELVKIRNKRWSWSFFGMEHKNKFQKQLRFDDEESMDDVNGFIRYVVGKVIELMKGYDIWSKNNHGNSAYIVEKLVDYVLGYNNDLMTDSKIILPPKQKDVLRGRASHRKINDEYQDHVSTDQQRILPQTSKNELISSYTTTRKTELKMKK